MLNDTATYYHKSVTLTECLKTLAGMSSGKKIALALFMMALFLYGMSRGYRTGTESDIYTYWNAGRNFIAMLPLYPYEDVPRPFIYPPFAAMFMGLIGVLPFKAAVFLVEIVQVFVWFLCFCFSAILVVNNARFRLSPAIIYIAFFATFNFFLNNFNLLQINSLLFLFILMFLYFYDQGKDAAAGAFLALAMLIKLYPGLFFVWLVIRGRGKTVLWASLFTAAGIAVPMLARMKLGALCDIRQFVETMAMFSSSVLEPSRYGNYSLAGLVVNSGIWLDPSRTQLAIHFVQAVGFLTCVLWLVWLRFARKNYGVYEIAGVFAAMLLLSPLTRKCYMLFLLFPVMAFLAGIPYIAGRFKRHYTSVVLGLCLVFALTGKDIIGKKAYNLLNDAGIFNVALFAVFVLSVAFSLYCQRKEATIPETRATD